MAKHIAVQGSPVSREMQETKSPEDFRTVDLDFVILGGGMLGTSVAALASGAGYRVLVVRMSDKGIPRADTLRNQGWLQSGLLYPFNLFTKDEDFRRVGAMTYFGGREMLAQCGMEPAGERAVVRVLNQSRIATLEQRARILRLRPENFRRLATDEAQACLGYLYESNSSYFVCPDCPFDEAAVLSHLRDAAAAEGAEFCEIDEPVTLARNRDLIEIRWGATVLQSAVTLIVAGAGGLELAGQLGCDVPAHLRQTPLLVHSGTCGLPSPILVDFDRGFAAVKHECIESNGALVVGTRIHRQPAAFLPPHERRISREDTRAFRKALHPELDKNLPSGRFTAGFEVMPTVAAGVTFVEPFVKRFDNVVFASPGHATLGLRAARKALSEVISIIEERGRRRFQFLSSDKSPWTGPIEMHYRPIYNTLNDAES